MKHICTSGIRYGKLLLLEEGGKNKHGLRVWKLLCDCGNIVFVTPSNIMNGSTKSCGCLRSITMQRKQLKHGMSHTKIYQVWRNMIARCYNKSNKDYNNYGGRGIKVCEEWIDFKNFMSWSLETNFTMNLQIERIDNDSDYCPTNCCWKSKKEQAKNRRTWSKYAGNQPLIKQIKQLAKENNISESTIYQRLYRGWSFITATTTPVNKNKSHRKLI